MALGEIAKQLTQQAIQSQVQDVLGGGSPKPAGPAPSHPEPAGLTVLSQLQAMQKVLKEDEELVISFHAGQEKLRVLEVYFPSWHVVVLTGVDDKRAITRILSAVDAVQLVCKIGKLSPGGKGTQVRLIGPKPKAE